MKKGFTLIELLVVIAVIAVLMGILMPALSRVREQARRQTCANQVRQQVLGLTMYGNEYDNKLPIGKKGGWLWDLNYNVVNNMLSSGMTQEMFYCPSNPSMRKAGTMDWFWCGKLPGQSGGRLGWDGKRLSKTGGNENVWAGYVFTMDVKDGRPKIENDPRGEKKWLKSLDTKRPAMRELAIDAVLGQNKSGADYPYGRDFAKITGGATYNNIGVWDSTSHLRSDSEPLGGNIGYLDGHTEWRPFGREPYKEADRKNVPEIMNKRFGGNIAFWW